MQLRVVVQQLRQQRAAGALDLRDEDQRLADLDGALQALLEQRLELVGRDELRGRGRRARPDGGLGGGHAYRLAACLGAPGLLAKVRRRRADGG